MKSFRGYLKTATICLLVVAFVVGCGSRTVEIDTTPPEDMTPEQRQQMERMQQQMQNMMQNMQKQQQMMLERAQQQQQGQQGGQRPAGQ